MQLAVYVLVGIYLAIGFVYALFVVMNRGGGVFSIPINTLIGPIWFPFLYMSTIRSIRRKRTISKEELKELGIEEVLDQPVEEPEAKEQEEK